MPFYKWILREVKMSSNIFFSLRKLKEMASIKFVIWVKQKIKNTDKKKLFEGNKQDILVIYIFLHSGQQNFQIFVQLFSCLRIIRVLTN